MFKPLLFGSALFTATSAFCATSVSSIGEALDLQQYRDDVKTLASDEFEGRSPLSEGEEKTIEYLVKQFKDIGLTPAFGDSYIQPVPLAKITADSVM